MRNFRRAGKRCPTGSASSPRFPTSRNNCVRPRRKTCRSSDAKVGDGDCAVWPNRIAPGFGAGNPLESNRCRNTMKLSVRSYAPIDRPLSKIRLGSVAGRPRDGGGRAAGLVLRALVAGGLGRSTATHHPGHDGRSRDGRRPGGRRYSGSADRERSGGCHGRDGASAG